MNLSTTGNNGFYTLQAVGLSHAKPAAHRVWILLLKLGQVQACIERSLKNKIFHIFNNSLEIVLLSTFFLKLAIIDSHDMNITKCKKMGPLCLFMHQQALKLGYFYWLLLVKNSIPLPWFIPFFGNKFKALFKHFFRTQIDFSMTLKFILIVSLPRYQCLSYILFFN